jgi:ribosomal RNA-processing protein 1
MGRSKTRRKALGDMSSSSGSVSGSFDQQEENNGEQQGESPHVSFGRRLAAHDRVTRDRAVKSLRRYLGNTSDKTPADLAQIWEGLFFCMYHCDIPAVQQELAGKLGQLVHDVRPAGRALSFASEGLRVFQLHWGSIDRLRQDKFYTLVRRVFRETFALLRDRGWPLTDIVSFADSLQVCPLQPSQTAGHPTTRPQPGLQFHIADLFWEELFLTAPRGAVPGEVMLALVRPWVVLLAQCPEKPVRGRVAREIFGSLRVDWLRGPDDDDAPAEEQTVGNGGQDPEAAAKAAQWLPTPFKEIIAMLRDHAASEELSVDAARSDVYKVMRQYEAAVAQYPEGYMELLANLKGISGPGAFAPTHHGDADSSDAPANNESPTGDDAIRRKRKRRQAADEKNAAALAEELPSPSQSPESKESNKREKSKSPEASGDKGSSSLKRHKKKSKTASNSSSPVATSAQTQTQTQTRPVSAESSRSRSLQFVLQRNEIREFDETLSPAAVGIRKRGKGRNKGGRRKSFPPPVSGILKPAVPLSAASPWTKLHSNQQD